MPQASNELRKWADEFFGEEDTDGKALEFLMKKGWKHFKGWLVHCHETLEAIPMDEWFAFCYLRDEWDYAMPSLDVGLEQ